MLKQRHGSRPLATAEDLINEPISLAKNSTIYHAIEKILERNISGVLIRGPEGFGLLTQRDIAEILLFERHNISKIMSTEKMQQIISVDRFAPLQNCADLMLKKRTNMLGVRGKSGIKGVLTKHDLVRHYYENIKESTPLSEVMSIGSFFVKEDSSTFDSLQKMHENQISRLLIKNQKDDPVGIVTFKNFLGMALQQADSHPESDFTESAKNDPISQIMTKNIVTVSSNTSLERVSRILIEYRIHGVAITEGRRIVGFVTEKDIVRQIANLDLQ